VPDKNKGSVCVVLRVPWPELEDIMARSAVLVGINDYRGISDLRGCSNDVTHMRDIPRRKRK